MKRPAKLLPASYDHLLGDISTLLETTRRASARVVNALMTASYWEIGRRIVEHEQAGRRKPEYGQALIEKLSLDLTGDSDAASTAPIYSQSVVST